MMAHNQSDEGSTSPPWAEALVRQMQTQALELSLLRTELAVAQQ
jgi:hypothetical protein